MTETTDAIWPKVRTATNAEAPLSWIKGLIAEFSSAAKLVAEIISRDPVHTPGTARPDTIGLSERWDVITVNEKPQLDWAKELLEIHARPEWMKKTGPGDLVTFVDQAENPVLFVRARYFPAFMAGKDVAKVARGVGNSPQAAWSDLFTKLTAGNDGLPVLVVGKPGRDRRYYTLEPFNEAARLTRENPARCTYFIPESNTVRWEPWTPPIDMENRFAPRPAMR